MPTRLIDRRSRGSPAAAAMGPYAGHRQGRRGHDRDAVAPPVSRQRGHETGSGRRSASRRPRSPACRCRAAASPHGAIVRGTKISGRPCSRAAAIRRGAAGVLWSVTSTSCSPRLASGTATTACWPWPDPATKSSTAPSGTISPATLANRLARPLMVTKPRRRSRRCRRCRTSRPAAARARRALRAQITEHHVRPADEQPCPASSPAPARDDARCPGSSRPTVPALKCIGVFTASAGDVSVAP